MKPQSDKVSMFFNSFLEMYPYLRCYKSKLTILHVKVLSVEISFMVTQTTFECNEIKSMNFVSILKLQNQIKMADFRRPIFLWKSS